MIIAIAAATVLTCCLERVSISGRYHIRPIRLNGSHNSHSGSRFSYACRAFGSSHLIEIQADKPGVGINPAMWGIFFEDINFGADGGLYAELVKNRGFEFPDPMVG